MVVTDPFEIYTLAIGFLLNNAIYMVLMMTGISIVPFVYVIARNVKEAKEAGEDVGSPAFIALKRTEVDFMKMVPVLILFFFPNVGGPIYMSEYMEPLGQCNEGLWREDPFEAARPSRDQVAINHYITIGDHTPNAALAIRLAHNLTSGMAATVRATLPCTEDMRTAKLKFTDIESEVPSTQRFASAFIQQCYVPSIEYIMRNNLYTDLEPKEFTITGWASREQYRLGEYAYLNYSWPYIKEHLHPDAGFYTDSDIQLQEGAVYGDSSTAPAGEATMRCDKAYTHLTSTVYDETCDVDGIASKLFGPNACSDPAGSFATIGKWAAGWVSHIATGSGGESITVAQRNLVVEQAIGKAAVAVINESLASAIPAGEGHVVKDMVGLVGMNIANVFSSVETYIQRQINPILLSIIQGVFYMLIPLILVAKAYSPGTAILLMGVTFGLEFTNVIFAYAEWLDDVLMDLAMNDGFWIGARAEITNTVVTKVGFMMHTLLPLIYFAMLGLAGIGLSEMTGARSAIKATNDASQGAVKHGVGTASGSRVALKGTGAISKGAGALNGGGKR